MHVTGLTTIKWMSESQFILISVGFLAICVSVILMVRKRQANTNLVLSMGMAPWKIPFLFLMTITSLGAEGILAYLAFRRNLNLAAGGFILGVIGILTMGAFASTEQSVAMQWIEETINTLGQAGFMLGCILLHRDFKTRGCDILSGELR